MTITPFYSKTIVIPGSVIDENGHTNNVIYLQWMQDIAVEHYAALGGLEAQRPFGTWFIREHKLEYIRPAFAGEEIEIRTWVENIGRVRSLRKYEFIRKHDGNVLVKGETDWVFVDVKCGKPLSIPEEVKAIFNQSTR
jgi:acyl-CoA thioester hydrolase